MEEEIFQNLKRELEIKKLQKEIEDLENAQNQFSKKWFKKTQLITALVPIIVAISTLTVAWASVNHIHFYKKEVPLIAA